jgi:hypothetical protein
MNPEGNAAPFSASELYGSDRLHASSRVLRYPFDRTPGRAPEPVWTLWCLREHQPRLITHLLHQRITMWPEGGVNVCILGGNLTVAEYRSWPLGYPQ